MRHPLRHNRGSARAVIGGGHQPPVFRVAQFVGTLKVSDKANKTSPVEILNTYQTGHTTISSKIYIYFIY